MRRNVARYGMAAVAVLGRLPGRGTDVAPGVAATPAAAARLPGWSRSGRVAGRQGAAAGAEVVIPSGTTIRLDVSPRRSGA
ncbi:MAG: hypothetical protein R2882_08010 [Gemmatimonadales bacterium]